MLGIIVCSTRSFIMSAIFRVSLSQGKLHYQTSHPSQSDKPSEIWPILINYFYSVGLPPFLCFQCQTLSNVTAELSSRPSQDRAVENLVLISLISPRQNISNHSTFCPINLRPHKQTGQATLYWPAGTFIFIYSAQHSSINPVTSNGITGPG